MNDDPDKHYYYSLVLRSHYNVFEHPEASI